MPMVDDYTAYTIERWNDVAKGWNNIRAMGLVSAEELAVMAQHVVTAWSMVEPVLQADKRVELNGLVPVMTDEKGVVIGFAILHDPSLPNPEGYVSLPFDLPTKA